MLEQIGSELRRSLFKCCISKVKVSLGFIGGNIMKKILVTGGAGYIGVTQWLNGRSRL